MKKLAVFCDNHMDVIWRRGFKSIFPSCEGVTRPYADIEEEQIGAAVRLALNGPYRYSIEQAMPLRMFMERNPDLIPDVSRLMREGRIELMGGGETLIDMNMVAGEAIVRNQLYSILWCEEQFGLRQHTAIAQDTFGYPAQLPQILRGLGYETLALTSRFFYEQTRPFWRGFNGDTVLVRPSGENITPDQQVLPGGALYLPPTCCHGEGCRSCDFRGLDLSYRLGTA